MHRPSNDLALVRIVKHSKPWLPVSWYTGDEAQPMLLISEISCKVANGAVTLFALP
jgi:hypothetical protein